MKIKSQYLLNSIFGKNTVSAETLINIETLTIELLASYALTHH